MVYTRLSLILSEDELSRLTINKTVDNCIQIVVDVHGMKCYEARRFINNIINTVRCTVRLEVIHGYNHGTAIKDMLASDFTNAHIEELYLDQDNQGMTHMLIAA